MTDSEPEPLGPAPAARAAAPWTLWQAGVALSALLLLVSTAWFYAHEEAAERRKVNDNLDAISKLKAGQIAQWRSERIADAEYIARDRDLIADIDRWLKWPQADAARSIIAELRRMQQHANYLNIAFVDSAGVARLITSGRPLALYAVDYEAMSRAQKERRAWLSDLHPHLDGQAIHVDAVAPIITADGRLLGSIVMESAADDFLFPMIRIWPTASSSAETLLVRRDGDHVLFLNTLRYRPDAVLKERIPLSRTDVPAVQAVLGAVGVFEGVDYRNVPVLSVLRPIPDSPWFIITKLDVAEAYADWHTRASLILGMIAALVLTAAIVIIWLRHRIKHYRDLHQAEVALRKGADLTRAITDSIGHAIAVLDRKGSIIAVNHSWRKFAADNGGNERTRDGVGLNYLVVSAAAIGAEPGISAALAGIRAVLGGSKESFDFEYPCHAPDRQRWFSMLVTPLQSLDGGVVISHVDITARKLIETHMEYDRAQQAALRQLLEIVLTDRALNDTLAQCLDLLLALPWLPLRPWGSIQAQAAGGGAMEALVVRKPSFAVQDPGNEWCLPLRAQGQVVGALLLRVTASSSPDDSQKAFLVSVTNILATLIQRKRAEDAQRRFLQVLQQSTNVIVLTNLKGEIEFANDAFSRVTGYAFDEIKGQNPRLLKSGQTAAQTFADLWEKLKAGESWCGEIVNRRKNGEDYIAYHNIYPIRQADGSISHYASISEDVTERRRDAAELERYRHSLEILVVERTAKIEEINQQLAGKEQFVRTIADNIPGMVGYWDADLRCRFANAAYLTWFGKRPEEMSGISIREAMGEELFSQNEPHIHAVLRGERQLFERTLVKADGSTGHTLAHYIPDMVDGKTRGFYVVVSDVTSIKQAEIDSQHALEAARRLAQVRSDFLANMSHEIRTPLNAVLGLAQIGIRDSVGRRTLANFRRILDSGQHLLTVVNDILDFSKIEAGKMLIEQAPFALGAAIDRCLDLTAASAYAKGLDFRVTEATDLPQHTVGDAMRLTQVLVNLLSNAVKFTAHGGVALDVARADDAVIFRVTDSGIGMSTAQVARLFQAFEQGDSSTTRRFGGTGLGLAISKRLAEAMGGTLSVESRPDAGSSFELRLPLIDHDTAANEPSAPDIARIRLVGLNADEGIALSTALATRGIRAEITEAVAAFTAPLPDRIVIAAQALPACGSVWPAGVTVMAVAAAGTEISPESLPLNAIIIERPLRVRHLCATSDPHAARNADTGMRLAGLRVLAAEDIEVNRIVLEDILDHEGAQTLFAEDGCQAVELVRQCGGAAFDVVLMDIQMPHMGGIEATGHIRALAPALPVIGLSAHAMTDEIALSLAAGMVAHIAKPINVDTLVAALQHHALPWQAPQASAAPAPQAAAAPIFQASPRTDLIDWAALSDRYQGRQDFIDKLLATVMASQREVPAKLRAAAQCRDEGTIRFLAHAVKGVSGNIMAPRLQTLARSAENSARNGHEDAPALAEELAAMIEELLSALRARARQDAMEVDA